MYGEEGSRPFFEKRYGLEESNKFTKWRKAMRATTFEFSDDLYKAVRHQSVEEGVSLKDLVRRALSEYLERVLREAGAHKQESQAQM